MADMLLLIVFVGLPAWLLWLAYEGGKRDGSRKAYGVGRRHGRHGRRR